MSSTSSQARYCNAVVGARVTAFSLGYRCVDDVLTIVNGRLPEADVQERLEVLAWGLKHLQVAFPSGRDAIATCLFGMCPQLDDDAMIERLHQGDIDGFQVGVRSYCAVMRHMI